MVGGEGSSKSFLGALRLLCVVIAEPELCDLAWIVGGDFETCYPEAHTYLEEWLTELGEIDVTNSSLPAGFNQPRVIRTKLGQTIKTLSAYDPSKIGREEPYMIVGCEVSLWLPEAWTRCVTRISRRVHEGAHMFASGSPEKSLFYWFKDVYDKGQAPNEEGITSFSVPAWINPSLYPEGIESQGVRIAQASLRPEKFAERMGGKFVTPSNVIFREFKPLLHVRSLDVDPRLPVNIFIDPGLEGYSVLFVQVVYDEIRVLDEVFGHRTSHELVVQASMTNPLWKYTAGGKHVMDVAGNSSQFSLGSPIHHWNKDTGLGFHKQYCHVEDTIERIRSFLAINAATGQPRMLIDPKCRKLISELGGGRSPVDGGGPWTMKDGRPSTQNCDSVKALGYGGIAHFGTARPYNDPSLYSYNTEEGNPFISSYLNPVRQRSSYARL